MRYEVWVRGAGEDVKVYASDIECEARVLVDGTEVYHLTATPTFEEIEEPSSARVFTGGTVSATYVSTTGKEHKVMDEEWSA